MSEANPYAPPQAPVDDVTVEGESELAGRGIRLGAVIIDGLLLAAIGLPIWLWVLGFSMDSVDKFPQLIYYTLLFQVIYLALNGVLLARRGQTIGKRLLAIRVVRSDGAHASFGRVFWIRYFANTMVFVIPVVGAIYGLVDALMIFRDSRKCLHDSLADTIVVKA